MGSTTDIKGHLKAQRGLPIVVPDTQDIETRGSRYGEMYVHNVIPKSHLLADEGSYFMATNPTPGTGLATIAAQTSLVDTAPFILIKNNWKVTDPNACRLYLDYLKLIVTAAGTGGTAIHFACKIDDSGANRYTSGGSAIPTVNVNMDSGNVSPALVYAGALVSPAANGARLLGHSLLRPVIPVVGDTYLINFGGHEAVVSSMAPAGTAIANVTYPHAPVVIGPQQWCQLHIWLPSQSAASSYEFELGFWER